MNLNKHIEINKYLTVNNLKATIGMETQKEMILEVANRKTSRHEEL